MNLQEIPSAPEAERGLIASCIRSKDAFFSVSVPSEAFHVGRHQLIWKHVMMIHHSKHKMECALLLARMREGNGDLDDSDKDYTAKLFRLKTSEAPQYAKIVLDKWWLRRAIDTFSELLDKVQEPGASKEDLRDEVEERFSEMLRDKEQTQGGRLKERLPAYMDDLAGRAEMLKRDGTSFGLPRLDGYLGYHQPGDLVTIGSHSGVGKSLLALQGAVYNSQTRGVPVGLISLEMSEFQYYDRLFSHAGKIAMNAFKSGEFTTEGMRAVNGVYKTLMDAPFYFYREKAKLDRIKSLGRRLREMEGIKLLVIDYLQRIRASGRYHSRQEELDFIANDLKELAHELGLVIWCPVQLNKDGEVRGAMDILQASDISFRLTMEKDAKINGIIELDKSRQGESMAKIPVSRKGWFMTIEERTESNGH